MANARILIVDDSQFNRELLSTMLEDDYSIVEAADGAEAIEKIGELGEDISLVLLDINMPKVDGFGVLEHINETKLIDKVPVIMISAERSADYMEKAYDLGATDYINKPFNLNIVRHRVENTIDLFSRQKLISHELKDANQRYLDVVRNLSDGMCFSVHVNITRNTFSNISTEFNLSDSIESCSSIDELIQLLCGYIPDEEGSREVLEKFSRENLERTFREGRTEIPINHDCMVKGRRCKFTSAAGIMQNPATGDIEAILYSLDISSAYRSRQLERLLFERAYMLIGFLDIEGQTLAAYNPRSVSVLTAGNASNTDVFSYDDSCSLALKHYVSKEDADVFMANSQISNIVRMLGQFDRYFFIVRAKDDNSRRYKISFAYLDDKHETIVVTIADATREQELDSLTGEFSRIGFVNYVDQYLSAAADAGSKDEYSILFIDIKEFKAVNEMFSQEGGDMLLRTFAKHLKTSPIKPVFIGRNEADHFVCLVNKKAVGPEQLKKTLNLNFTYNSTQMAIRALCGIYHIIDRSIGAANMCDYAKLAEESIKNGYAVPYMEFSQQMQSDYIERTLMLSSIPAALLRGEFETYYQPIIDAKTGKIVSAEALIRWISPEFGMITPFMFIEDLEANGQISMLDSFVAHDVDRWLKGRKADGKRIVPISVNLSRTDFYDSDVMSDIRHMVESSELPTYYYRFELTESSYARFTDEHANLLRTMSDSGIDILLDDFGSGFSSFSTLRNHFFSILKLDMGFIRSLDEDEASAGIISSIIDMSHGLGLRVVCEGVEKENQVAFLKECGCDYIQGYYFSRPLCAGDFEALLDNETA